MVVIVDIGSIKALRVMNIYRSFNPQNGVSARTAFVDQLKGVCGFFLSVKFLPPFSLRSQGDKQRNVNFKGNT